MKILICQKIVFCPINNVKKFQYAHIYSLGDTKNLKSKLGHIDPKSAEGLKIEIYKNIKFLKNIFQSIL